MSVDKRETVSGTNRVGHWSGPSIDWISLLVRLDRVYIFPCASGPIDWVR